ncbi:MAG: hypothetical protein ABF904_04260 [Ethanoligenens sp.]
MRIVEFLHDDDHLTIPSNLDIWMEKNGMATSKKIHIDRNEDFPKLYEFDVAVLHGGRQHLWNKDADPWLYGEVEYVRMLLNEKKPVIGFGMGAGILAQALGAPAYRCGDEEQGFYYIRPWKEGCAHPLLRGLERGFFAYMRHSDHYALPVHLSLARSSLSPSAMFAADDVPAVGFQFHPEYTPAIIAAKGGNFSRHTEDTYPIFSRLMENTLLWMGRSVVRQPAYTYGKV